MNYVHSGDLGDIVYFLPVMKHNPGNLYVKPASFTRQPLDMIKVKPLLPLLLSQSYILSVQEYQDEEGIDCNKWRENYPGHVNLCHRQMQCLNIPLSVSVDPWLTVIPKKIAKQVINRSTRYHGYFPIQFVKDAIFVGTEKESKIFNIEFDVNIPFYPTKDLLEVAEVIAGAEQFIGNQSCCLSIAHGLKQKIICEVFVPSPNCIFERPNTQYAMGWTEKECAWIKF